MENCCNDMLPEKYRTVCGDFPNPDRVLLVDSEGATYGHWYYNEEYYKLNKLQKFWCRVSKKYKNKFVDVRGYKVKLMLVDEHGEWLEYKGQAILKTK